MDNMIAPWWSCCTCIHQICNSKCICSSVVYWYHISLMPNFHYLRSGNPATNQSHLIICCQDVSYWPPFGLSKYHKTLFQRHTNNQMFLHTNLLCIPTTNDQLQARPILKRPRDQRHSSKASFPSCFLSLLSNLRISICICCGLMR